MFCKKILGWGKSAIPAVYRMNIPKWRVLENHIGNNDISRVLELDKIWSSKLQGSLPPHVPPNPTLAIDCSLLT